MATKNLSEYNIAKVPDASNMCFGIVVSEWNDEITGALLDGCVSTLEKHGAIPENIHVKTVPGSFELIYGAHQMTLNDGFDAVEAYPIKEFVSERYDYMGPAKLYEKLGFKTHLDLGDRLVVRRYL